MSSGERAPLAFAQHVAENLADLLRHKSVRVEIAGSIRRLKPFVGDIDLVVEPKVAVGPPDLFGNPGVASSELDPWCDHLLAQGVLSKRLDKNGRPCWGSSLKRATYRGFGVDIRIVTDLTTWGAWLLISTGPERFNKAIVTEKRKGGLLPPGFAWRNGFELWRWNERIPTPDEASVFAALGLDFKQPVERT